MLAFNMPEAVTPPFGYLCSGYSVINQPLFMFRGCDRFYLLDYLSVIITILEWFLL